MMTVVFLAVVAAVAVILSADIVGSAAAGVAAVVVVVHSPAISLFSFSGIVRVHDRGAESTHKNLSV